MIVLDTNVVSEPLKPAADPTVQHWLDAQSVDSLYLTTISLAELRSGVAVLPDGRRKDALGATIERRIVALFGSHLLNFDTRSATAYAEICARTRAAGIPIGMADALIASIAAVHAFTVATRDTRPFEAAGLAVINPWE